MRWTRTAEITTRSLAKAHNEQSQSLTILHHCCASHLSSVLHVEGSEAFVSDRCGSQLAEEYVENMMQRLLSLLIIGLLMGVSATAFAQTDRERAGELAAQAAEAASSEDFQGAIELYEEALSLVADPSFAYNLGALYDTTGDLAAAYRNFSVYVELFPGAEDAEAIRGYLEEIESELNQAYTTISVESTPAGAMVYRIDGDHRQPLGETPLETWVPPGTTELSIEEDGYETGTERFNGLAGLRVPVDLTLSEIEVEEPDPDPDPDPEPDPDPDPDPVVGGGGPNVAGLVLLGVGVGAIGGGVGMFAAAEGGVNDYNDLIARIGDDEDPVTIQEINDQQSKIENQRLIGGILVGVGVVSAGVGTFLLLKGSPAERAARLQDPTTPRFGTAPMGRRGWGLTFGTHF